MNMRKLNYVFLALGLSFSSAAFSQVRSINSAEFALESGTPDDIIIAKEEIDKAAIHPKTANMPRMFLIRAKVYRGIFEKRGNPMIAPLSHHAGYVASQSIINFYENPDKKKADELEDAKFEVGNVFAATFNESQTLTDEINKASDAQKSFYYDTMVRYYQSLLSMYGRLDTSMINNLKGQKVERDFFVDRIAFFALNNSDKTARLQILDGLMKSEMPSAILVESYSKELLLNKDTAGAKRIIKEALIKTNNNNEIFNVLVNYYIAIDREADLMIEIDEQINNAPTARNYWIRGYLNEKARRMDEATVDYRKARELDEFYHDANWNLGVSLIKHESKKLLDAKSKASGEAKVKIDKELMALWKEAKGYLEYASENSKYTKDELIEIAKGIKTCCMELSDRSCEIEQRDKIRTLTSGVVLNIGDKFSYRLIGDAKKMDVSYQNKQGTVSTISDVNCDWTKDFDVIDKTDMLTLSVRINGGGTATMQILVNGEVVSEKEITGSGYLQY
jgi:hypothetical protein